MTAQHWVMVAIVFVVGYYIGANYPQHIKYLG